MTALDVHVACIACKSGSNPLVCGTVKNDTHTVRLLSIENLILACNSPGVHVYILCLQSHLTCGSAVSPNTSTSTSVHKHRTHSCLQMHLRQCMLDVSSLTSVQLLAGLACSDA